MDTPKKELAKIEELLARAREMTGSENFDGAQQAAREAISLDEYHAPSYACLADVFQASGNEEEAANWKAKGTAIRRQAWQRQVEAEARGHHGVLGDRGSGEKS